jgi:MFS family permease
VTTTKSPWYAEVTRYQWLVLAIASAGWIFDTFEGQIFNITRGQMLTDLLGAANPNDTKRWGDLFLAIFLLGGTFGGILFGTLADRYGRKRIMAATILTYSIFSGLTFFATELWHVAILRFLVAMGVGGEWSVAASLVAEEFPARARARASGIFHATSILGTWLAAIAGLWVGSQWRYAYLIGVLPALLVFWVRRRLQEPQRWREAETLNRPLGSFRELFGTRKWALRAYLGIALAAIGLGTFWGVTVAGQDLAVEMLLSQGVSETDSQQRGKFAYGIVQTIGGGLGLLSFGPLAERIGRRGAFALMQFGALIVVPAVCFLPETYQQLLWALPVFGFFTLGIHAGYAIYFPELFPSHLRATGVGICFNGGRLLAAPMLWISAELKGAIGLRPAIATMGSLFAIGIMVIAWMPETRRQQLPD